MGAWINIEEEKGRQENIYTKTRTKNRQGKYIWTVREWWGWIVRLFPVANGYLLKVFSECYFKRV